MFTGHLTPTLYAYNNMICLYYNIAYVSFCFLSQRIAGCHYQAYLALICLTDVTSQGSRSLTSSDVNYINFKQ